MPDVVAVVGGGVVGVVSVVGDVVSGGGVVGGLAVVGAGSLVVTATSVVDVVGSVVAPVVSAESSPPLHAAAASSAPATTTTPPTRMARRLPGPPRTADGENSPSVVLAGVGVPPPTRHWRPALTTTRGEEDDGRMDTATRPADPVAPASSTADPSVPPPATPRRTRNAGHVIAIVVGCFLLLPALGLVSAGAVAASAQAFATDDGYFRFTPDRIETDGVAIAATDIWLDGNGRDDGPDWLLDHLDVDLRLRVSGAAGTDDVFVGIARTPDVDDYLAGVAFADVVEMDGNTARLVHVPGADSIAPPGLEDIWAERTSGDGEQELTWAARGGRWAAVIMNADGSPVVAADVEIGVRSDAVMPIAIVLMVLGGLVLVGGIVLIVVGARGRRVPPTFDAGAPAPPASNGPLPPHSESGAAVAPDDAPADRDEVLPPPVF